MSFDTKIQQRTGSDPFTWFIGVVEDIDDPLQLGRVKIRVLGDHTQNKSKIPTNDLPWSYFINDVHSSSINGIGNSPTGLYVKGAWVVGFYWDSIDKQQPVVTGTFGGIPESIAWKEGEVGFQDPKAEFPLPHAIFEQDTNRLARKSPKDHAFEIPEDLVPEHEKMIKDGLCPKKPVFAKKYYDKFDEKFVRKFAQGEKKKHSCDDTEIDVETDCKDTTDIDVKDKKDEKCQYFIETNDHPFTIYKFINRERWIPKAKVFHDPMHRHEEYWHEPDNPWNANYPYNMVWEGYHKNNSTTIENPGEVGVGQFVSEAYGYNKTIEDYDGSEKEGIFRKQECGIGSWGLGEEWDSTDGAQRYHRFTPKGNYFEIDNDGNEVRKIYGDSFEIDMKDRSILIKGDWNVTVEGDKNELIEGDYNLQIMKDFNVDIRKDMKLHTNGKAEFHHKENYRMRIDGDERRRVAGNRNASILVDDYIESQTAERRADKIVRKGATSMIDEAFIDYELKVHNAEVSICTLDSQIETWNNTNTTMTNDIQILTEKIGTHNKDVGTLNEVISIHDEKKGVYYEQLDSYSGCIRNYELNTSDYILRYQDIYLVEQAAFTCMSGGGSTPATPTAVDVGQANYTETDGISQCLAKYYECIQAAKGACITTLKDPRTLKDYTRFDWEKYHASIDSCKRSYEKCIEAVKGQECGVCSPAPASINFDCEPCHDPNCPTGDKEYEFYNCDCECHGKKEEKIIDPWLDCEQEKP